MESWLGAEVLFFLLYTVLVCVRPSPPGVASALVPAQLLHTRISLAWSPFRGASFVRRCGTHEKVTL